MKRIGILSDTHGTFDAPLRDFFADVDELWHAGDFGGVETADAIAAFKPLRGVYGNIDGGAVRLAYPRWQLFDCEEVRVAMTHIGGYPGRYERGVKAQLRLRRCPAGFAYYFTGRGMHFAAFVPAGNGKARFLNAVYGRDVVCTPGEFCRRYAKFPVKLLFTVER